MTLRDVVYKAMGEDLFDLGIDRAVDVVMRAVEADREQARKQAVTDFMASVERGEADGWLAGFAPQFYEDGWKAGYKAAGEDAAEVGDNEVGEGERRWQAVEQAVAAERERWDAVRALVDSQAEDDALWSVYPMGVQPISEAYLQQELRRLHAAVEAVREASDGR